ncbi:transposable element Tc1 transposase [Trichonephila clavipes]|nr:transposable element Tc1 transposase [Trichonephila clavipes]
MNQKAKKQDLVLLAEELGQKVSDKMTNIELRNIIIGSKDYEEEFVRDQLSVILEERFEREISFQLHRPGMTDELFKGERVKFEQISVFERGRIVGLREAGLSYRAVAARVQRNSSTIMRVWKQWTDEGRTARKSVSGLRNVTSAREDRRLVRMAQTDRTAFSRQLAAQWSTATHV